MKHRLLTGLLATILTCSAQATNVPIQVDGTLLQTQGQVHNGTTYMALRPLLDTLGGWDLSWDASTGTAVATHAQGTLIADPAGTLTYNGATYPALVEIYQGSIYVPVRTVMEAQDGSAQWDGYLGGVAVTSPDADHDAVDVYWLSRVISAESQGEPLEGQIAVGNVVCNRVVAPQFPHTIADVVFDTNYGVQFEPLANGTLFFEPTQSAQEAALLTLSGVDVMGEALYFYAPALSQGTWIRENRTYYQTLGCHDFYL